MRHDIATNNIQNHIKCKGKRHPDKEAMIFQVGLNNNI